MVDYLPRSAWGARAPKGGPGSLTVSRVEGVVLHWPGTSSKTPVTSLSAVASALRGWQAFHMAPEPQGRGWSDIAYQVAVDQAGRAWTLRGLRTQSGANGNADLNERYGAILLVLIAGEQPSDAMKATVRAVIADYRRIYPNGDAIRPHSAVRPDGTDCPGDAARAAIARGDFTPRTTPPQEDEMTPAQMQDLKNFIEARTKAYALANNSYTRQVLSTATKTILAKVGDDDAVAAVAALNVELDARDAAMQADLDGIAGKLEEHAAPKA